MSAPPPAKGRGHVQEAEPHLPASDREASDREYQISPTSQGLGDIQRGHSHNGKVEAGKPKRQGTSTVSREGDPWDPGGGISNLNVPGEVKGLQE